MNTAILSLNISLLSLNNANSPIPYWLRIVLAMVLGGLVCWLWWEIYKNKM